MMRKPTLRTLLLGAGLALAATAGAQEPIDNCSSLLGSLSVELRYARNLSPSERTTFVCPRDTKALLGASKQRVIKSLGPPDITTTAEREGGGVLWSYFFGPKPHGNYPTGVPELRFEFDAQQAVLSVSCQRTR